MEELEKLEKERKRVPGGAASNEMCTFLILNSSSLQLIPASMIAYWQHPVWERESGRDYRTGDCANICKYFDVGDFS